MRPTAYIDLDGFIAQFTHGAARVHDRPLSECLFGGWNFHHKWGMSDAELYAPMNFDFWADLPVWPDGMALFESIEKLVGEENVVLLSFPCSTRGCKDGKEEWVRKHLPRHLPNLMLGGAKHKLAGPTKILVDDSNTNVEKFHANGGNTFLVPRPWNALASLCDRTTGEFDPRLVSRLFAEAWKL